MQLARLSCLALALAIAWTSPADIKLRGDRLGNWWTAGETVKFKADAPLPPDVRWLTGTVRDSSGKAVARESVDAAAFAATGWSWKPGQPGFYTVTFSTRGADDKDTELAEAVPFKLNSTDGKPLAARPLLYPAHNVAVLPTPTRPPAEIPPQVGVGIGLAWAGGIQAINDEFKQRRRDKLPLDSGPNMREIAKISAESLTLASLVGFNFIRLHGALWARLEVERGQNNWPVLDSFVLPAHDKGFKLIVNSYGTPIWAIDKPDTGVRIIPKHQGQMPRSLNLWAAHLDALVDRYPFVHDWELWNEPGLQGGSVFWYGSPDEFCELTKVGYETIKAKQPDSIIWTSCPFPELYKIMLKQGAAKYFDKYDCHGNWIDHETIGKLEAQHGVAKPWGSIEWHAILVSAGDSPYPTEEALARRMLLDFINQIRLGSERLAIHALIDGNSAKMLAVAREKGNAWFHNAGLFCSTPYVQPRLPALVFRNFVDCFSGKIRYDEGYLFGRGETQRAVLLASDAGKTLVLWQTTDAPAKVDPALTEAFGPGSTLLDWEGRKLAATGDLELRPELVYFLKNPDLAAVGKWTNKGQPIQRRRTEPLLDASAKGRYTEGHILDDAMRPLDASKLRWQNADTYVALDGQPKAAGLAARYALALNDTGLELVVEVSDPRHQQDFAKKDAYKGDSVQFALDTAGKGYAEDRLELTASLPPAGPLLWKDKSPLFDGYLLQRFSSEQNPVEFAKIAIDKTPSGLLYKIKIDKDELHPFKRVKNQPLRFSLLVNNNDGPGRAGYLEWASGVGKSKDPALYGTLTVDLGDKTILNQDSLKADTDQRYDACTVEFVKAGPDAPLAKVVSTAGAGKKGALHSQTAELVPGAKYTLSFKARGDVNLQILGLESDAKSNDKRRDLGQLTLKPTEWAEFSQSFIAPEGIVKLKVMIICWQQRGYFEVKNFSLATGAAN